MPLALYAPAMPLPAEFPLPVIVLAYVATAFLFIIVLLLLRMNSRIAALSAKLTRTGRSAKLEDSDAVSGHVEIGSGTNFEEFLNEEPERRTLVKKEQFKAYRKWRAEKGLNWAAKD